MKTRSRRAIESLGCGAAMGVVAFAGSAEAATFTVTNTLNANAGSLRAAINAAESNPGRDTIQFAIAGVGPHTIVLSTALPVLAHPVTIDGYSQAGSVPASSTRPAKLKIAIDAQNVIRGIDIGGDNIEVRGLAVHSAQLENVFVEGRDNVVAGNHIGTNVAGDAAAPPAGINVVLYGSDNLIGGASDADRNVIAGAQDADVHIVGGAHEVRNNRIGTTADGTVGLVGGYCIALSSNENLVLDNLISGCFLGIEIFSDHNVVQGNRVGTDVAGSGLIPNTGGINVEGGDRNLIGGVGPGQGNLVSGNMAFNIQIEAGNVEDELEEVGPGVGNDVQGNLVGTDVTGTLPLDNNSFYAPSGILIVNARNNRIGGDEPGAGNVIAGNAGHGIVIDGSATGNVVLGNAIGTNMTGGLGLGNALSGVYIYADRNRIGTKGGSSMNTIAYNGEDGVTIAESAAENAVVRNLIFENGTQADDRAIDLNDDGVTLNDLNDVDSGANALLNHPVILSARALKSSVDWTLDGLALTSHRLEFYVSSTCDASGSGDAQRYLGFQDVTTDNNGHRDGTFSVPSAPAVGEYVTMTATRTSLVAPVLNETSELSPCLQVN